MNSTPQIFVGLVCLCVSSSLGAAELEVTIRPHAREITFGDPLFIEVTILNRGNEVVNASPTYHSDRLRFEYLNRETENLRRRLDAPGEPSPLTFEPRKAVRFYQYLCFPDLNHFKDSFWADRSNRCVLSVSVVYRFTERFSGPGVEFRSNGEEVAINARSADEMQSLELLWSMAEPREYARGPHLGEFGLLPKYPLSRSDTFELGRKVKTGELADLIQLTILMQDLYEAAPAVRDARGQAVVDWLKRQPDIKRQALSACIQSIAKGYNLTGTAEMLKALRVEP